ncbi:CDP-alcohol phosphatidyltransferase family protein [Olsenella intestinalis]|uniref:CDP-alcohol phosphatidyltransferase family protein n=1 Tax=Olsenella intestinalis TaxID=2930083 RepID=UPI00200BDEB7|nr:CDP-alcohol phosphatidyltransferase family protein [Olsenella intestinalis]
MANALTICRIVLSVALLLPDAFSLPFFLIYALASLTDMLDGLVARTTGTESGLGARLDSIADFVLTITCMVKILPAIDVPAWLWVWVALIVLVKVVNVISGLVIERRLVLPHTIANKAAGLVVFLVPFAIPMLGVAVPAVVACAVATFAAMQEGHLIRTRTIGPTA